MKEHLKRLVGAGIQPHFMIGSIKDLETVERIVRQGQYMGPYVLNWVSIGGGHDGPNPRNLMEFINRVPQNAVLTVEGLMRHVYPLCTMGIAMGLHVRVGQEDNLYGRRGERATSVQQIEKMVKISERAVASDRDRRAGARDLQDRHLLLEHRRDAREERLAAEPQACGGGAAPGGVTMAPASKAEAFPPTPGWCSHSPSAC